VTGPGERSGPQRPGCFIRALPRGGIPSGRCMKAAWVHSPGAQPSHNCMKTSPTHSSAGSGRDRQCVAEMFSHAWLGVCTAGGRVDDDHFSSSGSSAGAVPGPGFCDVRAWGGSVLPAVGHIDHDQRHFSRLDPQTLLQHPGMIKVPGSRAGDWRVLWRVLCPVWVHVPREKWAGEASVARGTGSSAAAGRDAHCPR
jgi:hypothetical protein